MNESELDKLNDLLANEVSASKTYEQAKQIVEDDVVRDQIADCECSHKLRAEKLKTHIEELGATPIDESAILSSVADACSEISADAKDKDAVTALEAVEEGSLQKYQEALENADAEVRDLLIEQLMPAQEYTHDAVSILKISLQ